MTYWQYFMYYSNLNTRVQFIYNVYKTLTRPREDIMLTLHDASKPQLAWFA